MTDIKDFNKPDDNSNYLTEVLDTVKGNIKRVATRDPQNSANTPIGFKKLVFEDNNLKILSHTGRDNYVEFFNCDKIVQEELGDRFKDLLSYPTFRVANVKDFRPWVELGYNPQTLVTTRDGDIKIWITRKGLVKLYVFMPGPSLIPKQYLSTFRRYVKDITESGYPNSSPQEVEFKGTALESKVYLTKHSKSFIAVKDSRPLAQGITVLTESLSGNIVRDTNKSLYRYNVYNVHSMYTPYISGLPYIRRSGIIEPSFIGRNIDYTLPHFGLDSTPFADSQGRRFGPVLIDVEFGSPSTALSCNNRSDKINMNFHYYVSSTSVYLNKGILNISIPKNDIILQACINKSFPSLDGRGAIKYNPWLHGGLPGGRGAVIIEPLLERE